MVRPKTTRGGAKSIPPVRFAPQKTFSLFVPKNISTNFKTTLFLLVEKMVQPKTTRGGAKSKPPVRFVPRNTFSLFVLPKYFPHFYNTSLFIVEKNGTPKNDTGGRKFENLLYIHHPTHTISFRTLTYLPQL